MEIGGTGLARVVSSSAGCLELVQMKSFPQLLQMLERLFAIIAENHNDSRNLQRKAKMYYVQAVERRLNSASKSHTTMKFSSIIKNTSKKGCFRIHDTKGKCDYGIFLVMFVTKRKFDIFNHYFDK